MFAQWLLGLSFARPLSLFAVFTSARWRAVSLCWLAWSARALNVLLKAAFVWPRPDFPDSYYREIGFNFSGRAMLSMVLYGLTAYVIGKALAR